MNFFLAKFFIWWEKDPMRGKVLISLTALHLLALAFLGYEKKTKEIHKKQKIIVRTITPSAKPSFTANSSETKPQNASPKMPKSEPALAKPEPTPVPVKKPTPTKVTPKPSAKKAPTKKVIPPKETASLKEKKPPKAKPSAPSSKNLQQSLKEIEETIAKIATKNDKMSSKREKEISPTLAPLSQDVTLPFSTEEDYSCSLIDCLQEHLKLPDSGEVKIELILRKDGKIESIKVLSAKSERNKLHLEEQIPRLTFPPFPKVEGEKKSKVFILTFCNDF